MKILMVNKFLWLNGGSERYMFDAARELREAGHEVAFFGMDDARNVETEHRHYHVSPIDYANPSLAYRVLHAGRIVGKTVYSRESRRKMAELVRDFKPDVAHLHLISHQISPSILYALRDAQVPVVQTVHEYKLVCPNYSLYVRREGEICQQCFGGQYCRCIARRCVKDSLAASVLAAGAMQLHKALRVEETRIDRFLCSTRFLADKLVEGGVPSEKIRHFPLTVDLSAFLPGDEWGDYIVFVGRLVAEKGVATLIQAMARVPQCRLLIVGDGEKRTELEALATQLNARNIEFLGFRSREEVASIVGRARFTVVPSEWLEPCGLVVWEAYALGRPVIASRIGGIPENVDPEETGLLFEPGNVEDLAESIARLYDSLLLCQDMGKRGRAKAEALAVGHRNRLLAAYREAHDSDR